MITDHEAKKFLASLFPPKVFEALEVYFDYRNNMPGVRDPIVTWGRLADCARELAGLATAGPSSVNAIINWWREASFEDRRDVLERIGCGGGHGWTVVPSAPLKEDRKT